MAKNKDAILLLINNYAADIFKLIKTIQRQDKKVTFLKTFVALVLRVPEELCEGNHEMLGDLFALAVN